MRVLVWFLFVTSTVKSQTSLYDSLRLLSGREDTLSINLRSKLVFDLITQGDYDSALIYSKTLELLSKKINFKKGLVLSYNHTGMAFRNKGNNKKALENYELAIKLGEELGNKKLVSNVHHNIARVYDNQGNYSKALGHLFVSLKLKESNGDKRGIANTLSHIGNIYFAQNDGRALDYYVKSLKIQQEIKNYPGITIALNEIGLVHKKEKKYTTALDCFFQSLEVNKAAGYKPEIANSLNCIGTIYALQDKYGEALNCHLKALGIEEDLNNFEGQATSLIYIGQLFFEQKKYDKALDYFKKAEIVADSSGVLKLKSSTYEGLSNVYSVLNKQEMALQYYKSFINVRDSIYSDNNRRAAITNQIKYEYEKKSLAEKIRSDEEKKLTQAQLKQVKTQSYALIVSLILFALIGFIIFQRIRHNQKLKEYKLRDKIANDLHDDIGSALSSISMFSGVASMKVDEKTIENAVKKIEETSRETIENMHDIVWSIQPRSDRLGQVIDRMRTFGNNMFSGTNIDFVFNAEKEINELNLKMEQRRNLYLIYKEAINNAAKYSKSTRIRVELVRDLKTLKMVIEDNGIGFRVHETEAGNGLYTMKQRAQDLQGELNIVSDLKKGTRISLQFRPT